MILMVVNDGPARKYGQGTARASDVLPGRRSGCGSVVVFGNYLRAREDTHGRCPARNRLDRSHSIAVVSVTGCPSVPTECRHPVFAVIGHIVGWRERLHGHVAARVIGVAGGLVAAIE